jgi:hypothetical protein
VSLALFSDELVLFILYAFVCKVCHLPRDWKKSRQAAPKVQAPKTTLVLTMNLTLSEWILQCKRMQD